MELVKDSLLCQKQRLNIAVCARPPVLAPTPRGKSRLVHDGWGKVVAR